MEALDRLRAREELKLPKSILDPVRVNTLADIRRVLYEFDPSRAISSNPIPIVAALNDGEKQYAASTVTKSKSKREYILEGMDLVRRMAETETRPGESVEINGREMTPAKLGNGLRGHMWVDPIIKQWMGAYRDGLDICWDIGGNHYAYDIFTHKLRKDDAA